MQKNMLRDVWKVTRQGACLWILIGLLVVLAACGPASQTPPSSGTPTQKASSPTTPPTPTPTPILARTQLTTGDWPTYELNDARTNYNSLETQITPQNAAQLKLHWSYHSRRLISSQPVLAFGLIYWASWDGAAHATTLDGKQVWETDLGTSHTCGDTIGPTATPTATVLTIQGQQVPALLYSGGNATFYALDAATGKILWKTSLGTPPSHFLYSSPIFYKGSVYVGLSSFGDCPAIQGKVFMLNANTGAIQHSFSVVPNNCIGGGVWGSPTIDDASNMLYIATGSPDNCYTGEPYVSSLLKLSTSNLSLVDRWTVPRSQWTIDSDFGSTPTLFTAKINGAQHKLLGLIHKNGIYYVLDSANLSAGPLWERQLSDPYGCARCGSNTFSPSAWDGSRLYVIANQTTIQGAHCASSLRALDPATGTPIWEHCLNDGVAYAAVTVIPGIVIAEDGHVLVMVNASTGKTLFTFNDTKSGALFYSAASVTNGMLYTAGAEGILWAFGF